MKVDKRGAIVSAAIDLFARRGLHEVKLRDVADQSGFLVGSLYHFFPEKKQLYNAAVREAARRFSAQMNAVLAVQGAPEERLKAFCWAMMETISRDDPNMALMDRAGAEDRSMDFPAIMEGAATSIYEDLEKLLDDLVGERRGEVPNRWLASYVISLIYGAGKLHRNHVGLQKLDDPQEVARFLEGVVNFALAALRGTSPPRSTS